MTMNFRRCGRQPWLVLAVAVSTGFGLTDPAAAAQLLRCPDTIKVAEEVRAPEGWTAKNGTNERAFYAISVLNVDASGLEYDLHPDIEEQDGPLLTQTWNLQDYRDMPIMLRCRYQNTESAIEGILPDGLATCSQTFVYDPNIVNDNAEPSPATMECR